MKKIKSAIVILSILLTFSVIANIVLGTIYNDYNKTYTLKYISQSKQYGTDLNIEIQTKQSISFYAEDFAVVIDNVPYQASSLSTTQSNGSKESLNITTNSILTVYFRSDLSIPNNATFLYKGQTLELGKEIKFKHKGI